MDMDKFFQVPIYGHTIEVDVFNVYDGVAGSVSRTDDGSLVVRLIADAGPSTIAHECFHLAVRIYRSLGEPYLHMDEKNEPFAYLISYLVEEVTKRYDYLISPEYEQKKLDELKQSFDELNSEGIF